MRVVKGTEIVAPGTVNSESIKIQQNEKKEKEKEKEKEGKGKGITRHKYSHLIFAIGSFTRAIYRLHCFYYY